MLTILFDGIAYGMLLFVLACGLAVTLGLMNFVNLAHGAFAMAGGYVTVVLVNRLGVIPQGVTGALFPAVAGGYGERRAEVERAVRKSILYLLLGTLPMAAAGSFVARPAVTLLFGAKYLAGVPVLQTLIWVVPLLGPNLLMYDCLAAVRRQDVAARITLFAGAALIALYLVMIPLFASTRRMRLLFVSAMYTLPLRSRLTSFG